MPKMINLTIDGQPVTVPEGTLIVNAAKSIGIDIPVFCYHPKMEPVGMCRQCMVEVGRPMVDRATGKPVLDETGKQKIQFGPKLETSCTTPVSEGMVVLAKSPKSLQAQGEILEFLLTSHPLDCPVCDKGGECPLQNLTMKYASPFSRFIFDDKHHGLKDFPLGDLIYLDQERCVQCARCIRFQDEIAGDNVLGFYQRGRSTDIFTNSEPGFDSIFSGNTTDICPVGCNLTINTRREAKSGGGVNIKRYMPRQNESVNEIWICDKGRFAYHFVEDPDRLEHPFVKEGAELKQVSWSDAVAKAAAKLGEVKKDSLILASGRLSNEDLFNLKKLAEGLGGEALLYTHMGGGELTTRYGMAPGSNLGALAKGSVILVVASDLYQEAPVWYLRVKQAAARGATLVVANPRQTKLEKYAAHVIRYAYGDESGTISDLLKSASGKVVAEAIGSAENLVVFYGSEGMGLQGSTDLAYACAGLLTKTNHIGKPNNGLIGVWQRANDQGAWELGYQPAGDLAASIKDKVVYIAGADPAGDDPRLAEALKSARFVIVQELFETETARLADIVLPAQPYTEREGSFTSGERRAQRFYPAIPPRAESGPDFAITSAIALELGMEMEGHSASNLMSRIASEVETFKDVSYLKLAEYTDQTPIVGRGDMYYGGTTYENRQGLGVQLTLSTAPMPEKRSLGTRSLRPDEDHWLAVPITRLYDCGITVRTSKVLENHLGEPSILINPASAEKLGLDGTAEMTLDGSPHKLKVVRDETVPVSVALVTRSMGIPLSAPALVTIKSAVQEGQQ